MSRFLITGARGQDGTIAIELLRGLGHDVTAVSHSKLVHDENVISYIWDWKNIAKFCEILKKSKPDFILNFATYHHSSQVDFKDLETHSRMIEVNVNGLDNIIQAMLITSKDIGLVHASSSQIYTPNKFADLVTEKRYPDPSTIYGVTKYSGMKLIDYYKKQHGLKAGVAILFNHESEYRTNNFLTRLISRQAAMIKNGHSKNLHLRNIGAYADFSSARDVVDAIIRICTNDAFDTYIISSNEGTSIKSIVKYAFEKVNLDWAEFTTFDKDEIVPYLVGDNCRVRNSLGWEPKIHMKNVIECMVDYDLTLLKYENVR